MFVEVVGDVLLLVDDSFVKGVEGIKFIEKLRSGEVE